MKFIGFHHNYSWRTNPRKRWSPSLINRVALMDSRLRQAGARLFLHSPQAIGPDRGTVPGSLFENDDFIPHTAPVPGVNGNWTHRTRRLLEQGMGYREFGRWVAGNGIRIYVPHSFSELLGNKLETYRLVRGFNPTLHPHCEVYVHRLRQLEYFVESGKLSFIKPRAGSKGNRIITLSRDGKGLSVTRYYKGDRQRIQVTSLRDALEFIGGVTRGDGTYLIQHGVETLRHQRATFDIRVTMVHDGQTWHWLHEARLSPPGSDISNVSQGGEITATERLLFEVMGTEASEQLLRDLQSESFGLAAYLERLHPGEIMEVGFDFAVDRQGSLHLLEINTKPGLAGIGSDISIYDKQRAHEPLFERWVYPHTRYLADFLLSKAGPGSAPN